MFASNFLVKDSALKYERGKDKLTRYAQKKTIASGHTMENSFCSICGTLMYRITSNHPDEILMRIGTVDDFLLHETKLKPTLENFVKDRVGWFSGVEGAKQVQGDHFNP